MKEILEQILEVGRKDMLDTTFGLPETCLDRREENLNKVKQLILSNLSLFIKGDK